MRKLQLIKFWKIFLITALVNMFSVPLFAQSVTIRGKIVDEKGEPLPGATVSITGTTTASSTNIVGDFTLNVPANANSITISFYGYVYVIKTISTASRNLGTIPLAKNTKSLDEVVVVGYGSLRKQDVTGTVSTVDAKSLQEVPSANVFEQLKGKVAGLDVVTGANGPAITIRGTRTIGNPGADGPLIVLDGVPYYNFIENINPNDIKSIDVLKGASATAIYGSRGSGGVILITTNRGRVGQAVTSFDSYYGISTLEGKLNVLNGAQYAQLKKDVVIGSLLQNTGASNPNPLTATEAQALSQGVSTDWVNLIVKRGLIWDNNLRVSGGTEKTQFTVGMGYRKQTGLEPGNTTERISLAASIDHKINKVIKFGANIDESLRLIDASGGSQYGTAQWFSPLAYPYNPDGSINLMPLVAQQDVATANPLLQASLPNAFYNHTRGFVSNNIVYTEITPVDHLKYRYTVGYSFNQSLQGQYNGINGVSIQTIAKTNATTTNNYTYRLTQDHLLTYDNTFLNKHHINFLAGFSTEKSHTENSNMSALGIPEDANVNSNLNLGTFNSFGGSYTETGLISYISRLNYAYNNKYDLTATMRRDGNSALATGHQYTNYPSLGLGWVIANEDFMKRFTFVDNLKLRAGYGETSTTASSGAYGTLGQLNSIKYQYGGTSAGDASGVLVTNLVNTNLTWQRTKEYNLALDFGILKSRITGSFEVYLQKTSGIILNNILPPTTGSGGQNTNLGSSSNRGLELSLSSINLQNKSGISWTTDFNISFVRERIDALPNGGLVNIGAGEFVGQPQSVIYDLKKIGIWQLSDSPGIDAAKSAAAGGTVYQPVSGQTSPLQYPGQIRVQDLNGDGKIDANDNQIIGHFNPNYTFGLSNRFTYKNFDLSFVIQARMGFTTIVPYVSSSNSVAAGWQFLNIGRHNQPVLNYWTPDNQGGTFPEPNTAQGNYYSTLQYYDGSFIRMKSINFGYTIPGNILKHLGISSLHLYANVSNPFFLYAPVKNHGFSVPDAESTGGTTINSFSASGNAGGNGGGSNTNFRGVGLNAGEQTRDFIFGINARF